MDDFLPAFHGQEARGVLDDRLQHGEVALVVRELPERPQARADHLEDLRAQGRVLHDVDGPRTLTTSSREGVWNIHSTWGWA